MNLAQKQCQACQGNVEPLKSNEINHFLQELDSWRVSDDQKWLVKEYKFSDFSKTLDFVNKVGQIAEQENHHPNLEFTYGYCKISIQTHKINALVENDFILAAKIDKAEKDFGLGVNFSVKF